MGKVRLLPNGTAQIDGFYAGEWFEEVGPTRWVGQKDEARGLSDPRKFDTKRELREWFAS